LDVLANGLGGWAHWIQHRGVTHSLVGLVIQALVYAALFTKWDVGSYRQRALHYSMPIGLHILCDYLTAFGVPLLAPFSFQSFSADLMVDLGLIPMVCMGVGLTWLHRRELDGWRATRPMWMVWALYFMMMITGKSYAMRLIEQSGPTIALPTVVNPFHWRTMRLDNVSKTYHQSYVDLFSTERAQDVIISMPKSDFAIEASAKSKQVQEFLKDNRWPVARVRQRASGWTVEWGNLLFSTRGLVRGKVAVDVASTGEILASRKIFSFWNPEN
jgi:hypothetical protein